MARLAGAMAGEAIDFAGDSGGTGLGADPVGLPVGRHLLARPARGWRPRGFGGAAAVVDSIQLARPLVRNGGKNAPTPERSFSFYCVVSPTVHRRDELIVVIVIVIVIATAGWIRQGFIVDVGRFGVVVTVAIGEFHLAGLVNAARPRRHLGHRV